MTKRSDEMILRELEEEHTSAVAKVLDQVRIIVVVNEDHHCLRPDEHELGADRDEASVCRPRDLGLLQRLATRLSDAICGPGMYVTLPHGGVGRGSREASSYPG